MSQFDMSLGHREDRAPQELIKSRVKILLLESELKELKSLLTEAVDMARSVNRCSECHDCGSRALIFLNKSRFFASKIEVEQKLKED